MGARGGDEAHVSVLHAILELGRFIVRRDARVTDGHKASTQAAWLLAYALEGFPSHAGPRCGSWIGAGA